MVIAKVCKRIVELQVRILVASEISRMRKILGVYLPALARVNELTFNVVDVDDDTRSRAGTAGGNQFSGGKHGIVGKRAVHIGKEVLRQPVFLDQAVVVRHRGASDDVAIAVILQSDHDHRPELRSRALGEDRNGDRGKCEGVKQSPAKQLSHNPPYVPKTRGVTGPLRCHQHKVLRIWITELVRCPTAMRGSLVRQRTFSL